MNNRLLIILCGTLLSAQSLAFTCYFTLAKDSCWINYDVKVTVIDATNNQPLTVVEVPKGQSWVRQPFTCQPGQKLIYQASFEPSFWQSEAGKIYMAIRYWSLPAAAMPGDTAWDIPVCYPTAFAAVPFPPTAAGDCKCDFSNIPPVKSRPAN
jgi:hypothetical protein